MFSLFKNTPLLEKNSQEWIHDTFKWALDNFDKSYFKQKSRLVLPNAEFFPDRVTSIVDMSETVFRRTMSYGGLENWPINLLQPQVYQPQPMPLLSFGNNLRGSSALIEAAKKINISYNPNQINQPQDLVASVAQAMSSIMIAQKQVLPPGGEEFLPQAIDLVACFMGFGVIMSNTAYQFKGGCGSCNNPYANREVALPEAEMLYCLALFCFFKELPKEQAIKHLKPYLRKQFKQAFRDISDYRKTNLLR